MDEHLSVLLDWAGLEWAPSLILARLLSPARRPSEDTTVGEPDRVRDLVFSVPGGSDPKGEVGNLLKLCVEAGVGEGHAHLGLRKEALGRARAGAKSVSPETITRVAPRPNTLR